jgi:hypothetical protein
MGADSLNLKKWESKPRLSPFFAADFAGSYCGREICFGPTPIIFHCHDIRRYLLRVLIAFDNLNSSANWSFAD